ncbi:amphi-Trp domain-containing protein [Streptomyces sp. NPDC005423]|uniref:amphi-Trp domain-containing protein n=1 Tax=Streptomyces sp. NPDC005423 TaxID=3155343 RepID=UPI0033B86B2E
MKDLKYEQKSSLSRIEAADQLTALAAALREGGDAELEFGSGTLSLRIPDDLRGEVEVEVGDGEIELEIEFTWPAAPAAPAPTAPSRTAAGAAGPDKPSGSGTKARTRRDVAAEPGRSGTGAGRSRTGKRSAARTS